MMPALFSLAGGAALALVLVFGLLVGVVVGRTTATASDSGSTVSDAGDDLAPVARVVQTSADPATVRSAVQDLRSAVDRTATEVGIAGQSPADRASQLETAIDAGDVTVYEGDVPTAVESTDTFDPGDASDSVIIEAADAVGREQSLRSRTADRLLTYLSDPKNVHEDQLRETLATAVDDLDELAAIDEALATVPGDAGAAADRLTERLADADGERIAALRQVGDLLSMVVTERDDCRERRKRFERAGADVCAAATAADVYLEGDETIDRLETLATVLERGDASFGSGVADATQQAQEAAVPESALAQRLATELVEGDDLRETLRETFDALDEAEALRTKLQSVRSEAVSDLADTVRASLEGDDVVETTLHERVNDLVELADGDQLLAYAARQELQFYDRTLLPRLHTADVEATAETEDTAARVASVRERRDEMRTSFPREFDEVNHEIPVLFLETADDLLDEAETAVASGDTDQAVGVATATDAVLDTVETLYHRDAYYTLLKRLRA